VQGSRCIRNEEGCQGLVDCFGKLRMRKNPLTGAFVESHPSAKGALGWGTRVHRILPTF
jgi:hypothetical protein